MGINYNPRIVTDSLVSLFDVGNAKSYPGTGNTIFNLANNNSMTGTTVSTAVDAIAGTVLDHNSSTALSCSFSSPVDRNSWSLIYWVRSTGLTVLNYRSVIILAEPNASFGYFYSVDTRETTNSRILAYQKDYLVNDWLTVEHVNSTDWGSQIWWCFGVTHDNTVFRHYNNGVLFNTATQTRNVSGYGDLSQLTVNTSGSNTVYMGPTMFYSRVLSNAEMNQNFNSMRGRFGV